MVDQIWVKSKDIPKLDTSRETITLTKGKMPMKTRCHGKGFCGQDIGSWFLGQTQQHPNLSHHSKLKYIPAARKSVWHCKRLHSCSSCPVYNPFDGGLVAPPVCHGNTVILSIHQTGWVVELDPLSQNMFPNPPVSAPSAKYGLWGVYIDPTLQQVPSFLDWQEFARFLLMMTKSPSW